jgi:hypothetical protein
MTKIIQDGLNHKAQASALYYSLLNVIYITGDIKMTSMFG